MKRSSYTCDICGEQGHPGIEDLPDGWTNIALLWGREVRTDKPSLKFIYDICMKCAQAVRVNDTKAFLKTCVDKFWVNR